MVSSCRTPGFLRPCIKALCIQCSAIKVDNHAQHQILRLMPDVQLMSDFSRNHKSNPVGFGSPKSKDIINRKDQKRTETRKYFT